MAMASLAGRLLPAAGGIMRYCLPTKAEGPDMSSRSNLERLVALEKQMEAAAEAFDFKRAAALRDEIMRLKGEGEAIVGQAPPGQIGLGSNAPVREPPRGWVKPKKPDLMTKNHKGRGER